MNIKMIVCSAVAVAVLAGCESEKTEQSEHHQQEAALLAAAKVSRETASQTALARVPQGTIKNGELEKENGKLIWSFDIAIPDSKNIKEVAVDAITGEVLAMDIETPEDQAKEAAADAVHPNKDKDTD